MKNVQVEIKKSCEIDKDGSTIELDDRLVYIRMRCDNEEEANQQVSYILKAIGGGLF